MEQHLPTPRPFAALIQPVVQFNRALSPLTSTLTKINNALEPIYRLSDLIGNQRIELGRAAQDLAEYGWYIDDEMAIGEPQALARRLNEEGGDTSIAEYYRKRVDGIENELVNQYPHRRDILSDAFEAHREGKYNLSIPTFLSQADGIWWDKFSVDLFRGEQRRQAGREYVAHLQNTLMEEIFNVFNETLPLWQNRIERGPSFSGLNRHQILHGDVVDYGNEKNSLMCISFIGFLCWILNCDEESDDQDLS